MTTSPVLFKVLLKMKYKVGGIYKRTYTYPNYWSLVRITQIVKNYDENPSPQAIITWDSGKKVYRYYIDVDPDAKVCVCDILAQELRLGEEIKGAMSNTRFCTDKDVKVEEIPITDLPLYIGCNPQPSLLKLLKGQ